MAAPTLGRTALVVPEPATPAPLRPAAVRPATLLACVGLIVSVAAIVATTVSALSPPVRLIAVLLFAFAGPGAAILAHVRLRERTTAAALALVLSLAVFATVPTVFAWLDRWAPVPAVVVLAALSAVSCAVALVRAGSGVGRLAPLPRPAWRVWWRRSLVDAAVLVVAVVAWQVALTRTNVADVGQFGLSGVLYPLYWVAPVLCVAGVVVELARGARRGGVLMAYLVVLILVLHATTPTLLTFPEYAWTYKHIGVVDFFASGQHIVARDDIYQQWPAFFTAAAQLTGASGANPLSYAGWAPVVFNLAGSFVLFAVARTITTDRRVAFGTVLVFQCINWIEEDYLSPQGVTFILSLGVFLVLLRWLRATPEVGQRRGFVNWLRRGAPQVPPVSGRTRTWAIAAVLFLTFVITAAHQLSPYLVAASVIVLVLFGLVRPWWLALAVPAVPILYLIPRFGTVSGAFSIFDGFNVFGNASGTATTWGSVGQAFSALTVRGLSLAVWLLVALVLWRKRHALGTVVTPLLLAIVPFGLLFAQNYGGEAIYRVFLFSAPWCAYLIAGLATEWSDRWRPPRWVGVVVATFALTIGLAGTIQGRHGQLEVDQQHAADIAAAQYLYSHAEPGATIVLATTDFPSRLTANYGQFNRSVPVGEPDLATGAKLTGVLDGDAIPAIESFAGTFEGSTTYLVISGQMRQQAQYFGYLPDGSLDALQAALAQAPQWTVFYRNSDVTIYQLRP